jgi:nucleoside-diphosphate-sugar epimerase
MEAIVVVTGAAGAIGRRVVDAVASDPHVTRVVAVDHRVAPTTRRAASGRAEVRFVPFALDDPRLALAVAGATELVHLGPAAGAELDGTGGSEIDVDGFAHLLGVLDGVGSLERVVVLSTALVYGSRDDNPVPITETASTRPDPEVAMAVAKSRIEAMARVWADTHGATCTLLRPSLVVCPETGSWLARSPWSSAGLQVSDAEPPVQFLHVDDLVSAISTVRHADLDGVVNVAPDGWLTAAQLHALKGPTARVRLPRRLAYRLARWGGWVGLGRGSADAVLAASAPWVVANDRLRAAGWAPEHTSAEAFVEADPGGPWSRLTPRHRQAIALGAVGAVVVAAITAVVAVVVHQRRRVGG